MNTSETTTASLRLLDWYREMGVDAAVGEHAVDWFARSASRPGHGFALQHRSEGAAPAALAPATQSPPPPARQAPPPKPRAPVVATPPRTFGAATPDAAIAQARAAAGRATSLQQLVQYLDEFDGCGLKATAKSLCVFRGAAQAPLMVVGDAPGREEDLAGRPFLGPAGALLDKMLAAIGLQEGDCHITNAVYWRPPGNRTPTPQELEVCRPFLERQVALVAPKVVLLLGAAAARQLLDVDESLVRARGVWRATTLGGHAVRAMITHHPNALLKVPSHKQHVWRDLLAVKAALSS